MNENLEIESELAGQSKWYTAGSSLLLNRYAYFLFIYFFIRLQEKYFQKKKKNYGKTKVVYMECFPTVSFFLMFYAVIFSIFACETRIFSSIVFQSPLYIQIILTVVMNS